MLSLVSLTRKIDGISAPQLSRSCPEMCPRAKRSPIVVRAELVGNHRVALREWTIQSYYSMQRV